MQLFKKLKDGGPESKVTGYFLIEIKSLFSIVLLHFEDGSRDAYHSHAFNCISWVVRGGQLVEWILNGKDVALGDIDEKWTSYRPSFKPIITKQDTFHKVVSNGDTWVLSFRGPWLETWQEYWPKENKFVTLTHGREVVNEW